MHPTCQQEGSAGNSTQHHIQEFPGVEVPIPWEEVEWAPSNGDCRAASSPAHGVMQVTCAGDKSHTHLNHFQQQPFLGDISNKSSRGTTLEHMETTNITDPHRSDNFAAVSSSTLAHGPLLGAPGPDVVCIQGGRKPTSQVKPAAKHTGKMEPAYATTTEVILQNLTMTVGNPSARCYANAPWRAFTWTCALLQETNTQPWGKLKEAVQESLELAEAVDIQQLPGLQPLWKRHDLNMEGDANHFVNPLWNVFQSRAFHHRFAEIQPGGYLTDQV